MASNLGHSGLEPRIYHVQKRRALTVAAARRPSKKDGSFRETKNWKQFSALRQLRQRVQAAEAALPFWYLKFHRNLELRLAHLAGTRGFK
jgi:hypothetical protein